METFKLKSSFVNSRFVYLLIPLFIIGIAIYVESSSYLELTEYAPIIIIGAIGFIIYDIYKITKHSNYFITISDEEINLNNESKLKWDSIISIKYTVGFGTDGIIIFNNDKNLKVPAVIDNLDILKNQIEKRVPESCKITKN
jgi:hypothetical protein